jgi:hypothetical protein
MNDNPSRWRHRADICVIAAATFALHFALAKQTGVIAGDGLVDTDAYMRLIRVQELWQSGDWYQISTSSLGAPGKLSLHWTRPLDILILLPAMLLNAFGLAMDRAVYWVGVGISPLLHFLAAIAAAVAARPLWPQHGAWRVAALMVLLNGAAMTYSLPARPDHHSLGLLLTVLSISQVVRTVLNAADRAGAVKAGAWAGFGVWVSPEALIGVAPILIAFGCLWLLMTDNAPAWARKGRLFSTGMGVVILAAIILEHPPADWLRAEYDKVSILHLALAVTAAADFWLAEKMPWGAWRRAIAALAVAAVSAWILTLLFPGFYLGPLGNISAAEAEVFLNDIKEMSPIWPVDPVTTDQFFGMIGNSLAALPVIPYCLWAWRRRALFPAAILLSLTYLIALLGALEHQRLALFLCAYSAVLGCGLFGLLCDLGQRGMPVTQALAKIFAAFVTVIGAQFWLAISEPESTLEETSNAACNPAPVAAWLNTHHPGIAAPEPSGAERKTPIIITESINYPPELAYRTGYRFVGGPYHRGIGDISDMYKVALDTGDAAAREVIARRNVDYLLICIAEVPQVIGESAPDSLYHRLLKGEVPDWLQQLPMSAEADREFRLFAIRR